MEINPYESPRYPAERLTAATPWWLQAAQFCGLSMATGVTLGALANALNGWVCPEYFVYVMHWDPGSNVWLRSILQGALEGLVTGGVLSVAFFGIGSWLTRFRLTLGRAVRYLAVVVIAAVLCAGLLGVALMCFSEIIYIDLDREQLPRFGWVWGCISGLQLGGALAAFVALTILVARDWLCVAKVHPSDDVGHQRFSPSPRSTEERE